MQCGIGLLELLSGLLPTVWNSPLRLSRDDGSPNVDLWTNGEFINLLGCPHRIGFTGYLEGIALTTDVTSARRR